MDHTIIERQSRRIRANYRSVTGTYTSSYGPLEFESKLERDAYLMLDFEPAVEKVQVQPMRLGNYTPDCMISTNSRYDIIAEIKYKQELLDCWPTFQKKFAKAEELANDRGIVYGFITDETIYAERNRLDVLKWIRFMSREASNNPDIVSSNSDIQILSQVGEVPLGKLGERIAKDQPNSLQQVCFWISSKVLSVRATPTADPMDAILSTPKTSADSDIPFFAPYHEFMMSIMGTEIA